MHTRVFRIFIVLSLLFASCKQTAPISDGATDTEEKTIEMEGEFRSQKGVMVTISCYCYNNGVLTQADGSSIDICFDEDIEVECSRIRVKGNYIRDYNNSDDNNPCAGGSMRYFKVESYECL